MRTSPRSRRSTLNVLAVALGAAGLAGCGDPFEIQANLENVQASFTLYAFNGTPATAPAAAVLITTPTAVRMGSTYSFDFALDFSATGEALLYPVDLVASDIVLAQDRYVGFQKVTGEGYDQLLLAPNSGYTYDAPLPVAVGDVGYIQSNSHPLCRGSFTPQIYAKFRVDAVDAQARTVTMTVRSDPNCGFRGLDTGLPER